MADKFALKRELDRLKLRERYLTQSNLNLRTVLTSAKEYIEANPVDPGVEVTVVLHPITGGDVSVGGSLEATGGQVADAADAALEA